MKYGLLISALILKSTLAFGGLKADQLVEQCILKTISNTQAVRIVAVDGGYGEMLEVGEVTSQREIPVYRSLDLSKFDVLKKNFRKLNSDTGAVSLVKNYLFGQFKTKLVGGGGCGSQSLSGQFAKEGIIIVKTINGISFRNGRTEGLSYCSKCGCWYSGQKCPICG